MRRVVVSFLAILVVLAVPFTAMGWTVNYLASNSSPGSGGFFSRGSYEFLVRPDAIQVYRLDENWTYLGVYGQAVLPPDFPAISVLTGFDQIVVTPGGGTGGGGGAGGGGNPSIGASDPLGAFLRPPVKIERGLQLGSAMIATGVLRVAGLKVRRWDTDVILPHATVQVWWQCAGVTTMLMLAALAGVLAVWTRRWYLVPLALVLALLDNGLRVAAIGLIAEYGGIVLAHGWHDWIGRGVHVLAAVPVVLLGRR